MASNSVQFLTGVQLKANVMRGQIAVRAVTFADAQRLIFAMIRSVHRFEIEDRISLQGMSFDVKKGTVSQQRTLREKLDGEREI